MELDVDSCGEVLEQRSSSNELGEILDINRIRARELVQRLRTSKAVGGKQKLARLEQWAK